MIFIVHLVTPENRCWSGGDHRVPQSHHHVIAPRGQHPHLLSQIKAADSPGELEDVAVQLVSDVHDDDGGCGVPGAGDHCLVVSEVTQTIDTISMETLPDMNHHDMAYKHKYAMRAFEHGY